MKAAGLPSERASLTEDENARSCGWRRGTGRTWYERWKKSLQKVKSDQTEGCTIVQGMKALD